MQMCVGQRASLDIPAPKAYGAAGAGDVSRKDAHCQICANAALYGRGCTMGSSPSHFDATHFLARRVHMQSCRTGVFSVLQCLRWSLQTLICGSTLSCSASTRFHGIGSSHTPSRAFTGRVAPQGTSPPTPSLCTPGRVQSWRSVPNE